MKATKLHAWRDAELAQVGAMLLDAFVLWRQAWGLPLARDARVSCAAAEERGRDAWQPLGARAASGAWVHWSPAAQAELQSLLGPGAGSSCLVQEAASACRQDACRRLGNALMLDANESPDDEIPSGKWSGAVTATLPCGSRVLADASCVQHALHQPSDPSRPRRAALPPVTPLLEAARNFPTRVDALLADCDLDVALLQRLRVGDVVRLQHPLARPLCVRDPGGRALFDAYLARSGAHRAIELVAMSPLSRQELNP